MLDTNTNHRIIELPSIQEAQAWEAPILFEEHNLPEIPARLLPPALASFASALAAATETPQGLATIIILGVLSTCLAKRFVVSPKANWREPVNIYVMLALPPANLKSVVLKACVAPLVAFEKAQQAIMAPKIKSQQSELKTQLKIIEALRARAAKEKDAHKRAKIVREIAEQEAKLHEPDVLPVLFANDATPESLAESVYEQNGRFAIITDEGGILETLSGLYSNGTANLDIVLKGIDAGDMRVKRKNKEIININPYLTFALVVQPQILRNMSSKKSFTGNGMLERFLYALPKSNIGYRTHNTPPVADEIKTLYENKIRELLQIELRLNASGEEVPYELSLDALAFESWRLFQSEIEDELKPGGRLENMQGWGGKLCGFTLRIAGLLHVVEHGHQSLIIGQNTMMPAIQFGLLFIDHALAAYDEMGADMPTNDARALYNFIKDSKKPRLTKAEITYAMRRKMKSSRLLGAINVLIERNIISEAQKLPTRKPTTVFFVNPEIFND